jgi:alkanesulfonate monooxygenase SsuD/methylene tetrahydromethanopterin reductase-like flavin-dependent oxidoreductase (luciferase family)
MLDEAIPLLQQMWRGETVHHSGDHYVADDVMLLPPATNGRIPIWLAARTTNRAPLRRAAANDGLFAIETADEKLAEMLAVIAELRGGLEHFEVAVYAPRGRNLAADEATGVTWWMTDIQPGITAADALVLTRTGPPV